jgi:hypothetical protein
MLKEQIDDHKGGTPFAIRILENNDVYHVDFSSFSAKINAETFIRDLKLPVPHMVELA